MAPVDTGTGGSIPFIADFQETFPARASSSLASRVTRSASEICGQIPITGRHRPRSGQHFKRSSVRT
jgi:hypothetical protein